MKEDLLIVKILFEKRPPSVTQFRETQDSYSNIKIKTTKKQVKSLRREEGILAKL